MSYDLMAIDPGTLESAWVKFVRGHPVSWAKERNATVLRRVDAYCAPGVSIVCEDMEPRRMVAGAVIGAETYETLKWCGRFDGVAADRVPWTYIRTSVVRREIAQTPKAKDGQVRAALIDLYGGKELAIGKKAHPGPLYGMSGDVWAALAVGITWMRLQDTRRAAA